MIPASPDPSDRLTGVAPVLDPRRMAELREMDEPGQPSFLVEMIELFLADAPRRITQIGAAARGGDLETVISAAHAFKGSAASIGGLALYRRCHALEACARAGDAAGVRGAAEGLDQEYSRLASRLEVEKLRPDP